jgi:hypothetical protein
MTNATLSSKRWLDAMIAATNELAQTTFNSPPSSATLLPPVLEDREGSLLPIYLGGESLQLGVLATPATCRALTKALLDLGDEEEPEDSDIPDAVGEIVNIIAGIVQRSIDREDGQAVTLGYPIHFCGNLVTTADLETLAARMNLGPGEADLVVIRAKLNQPKQPLFRKRR